MALITVVICTYHRPALLEKCLRSLQQQTISREDFTVLVVDNYGCTATRKIAKDYSVAYVLEPTAGLSTARNKGARVATTPWVFYLDDDGIALPDMLEQFQLAVGVSYIGVIGGRYEHYFAEAPAKWVKHYYRSPVRASQRYGSVLLEPGQYLSGGIMAARRSILLKYPFDPTYGMNGLQPGFGEENEWQDRLRRAGVSIHYNDKIGMTHLVQSTKQTIRNRINLAYAHGRYHFLQNTSTKAVPGRVSYCLALLSTLFSAAPYDVGRTLMKPGFYWQNGLISTIGKLAFVRGKYGR